MSSLSSTREVLQKNQHNQTASEHHRIKKHHFRCYRRPLLVPDPKKSPEHSQLPHSVCSLKQKGNMSLIVQADIFAIDFCAVFHPF